MKKMYWLLMLTCVLGLAAANGFAQGGGQGGVNGRQQFISHCSACHGEDAHGGPMGPNIVDIANPRATSVEAVHGIVRSGIPSAGMPAFNTTMIPDSELDAIATYVMALKAPAAPAASAAASAPTALSGDAQQGFQYFTGQGKCVSCHAVQGRGGVVGPDLGNVGSMRTPAQIEQALIHPGPLPAAAAAGGRRGGGGGGGQAAPAASYAAATVKLKDGKTIRGALKAETNFDIQLMGLDGHLYLLNKDQVADVTHEQASLMPAVQAGPDVVANVVAYLAKLKGAATEASTPLPSLELGAGVAFAEVAHPKEGEWPTYNGNIGGNRYSTLTEINTTNVSQMGARWMWTMPGTRRSLEDTPQVVDGIMYVTASNECYALDARTGRQIWHYERPRTKDLVPTGDAISGINRGVAVLGDRVFMDTDNAHLIALNRYTGQLVWDSVIVDYKLNYGTTQAPLAVNDLVITGVSGGDEGVRGVVSAFKASTGELVWRWYTSPLRGEPGSETWVGTSLDHPGASTWMTGTYDPETDMLYWGVGSPGPDFNGDERKGINLWGCAIVALNPHTGKLVWYHQQTLHGTNDWDATQTPMLVDAEFHGKPRKMVMQANRNGIFYVLDRTNGEFLAGGPFIHKLNWASGLDKEGHPIITKDPAPTTEGNMICPPGAGATNWPSASFDSQTGQFLVFATEACQVFTKNEEPFAIGKSFYQGTQRRAPGDTSEKFLRALDPQTGKIAWEIPNMSGGPLAAGLMTTAGGLLFYADGSSVVAADAKDGKTLWHFETGQRFESSPMAYTVDGHERLVIIAGSTVLSFGIR